MATRVASHLAPVQPAGSGRVDEPWGDELRRAVTDRYLAKLTHIDAAQAIDRLYDVASPEHDL